MGRRRQQSPPGDEDNEDISTTHTTHNKQQQQGAKGGKGKGGAAAAAAAAAVKNPAAQHVVAHGLGGAWTNTVTLTKSEGREGNDVEIVVRDGAGTRLDAFLAQHLSHTPRARVSKWIVEGECTVNGSVLVKRSYLVKRADCIRLHMSPPPPSTIEPEAIPLDVVYEDEHLIVINKSAGMVVHPAPGLWRGTLVNALLHHFGVGAIEIDGLAAAGDEDENDGGGGAAGADSDDDDDVDTGKITAAVAGLLSVRGGSGSGNGGGGGGGCNDAADVGNKLEPHPQLPSSGVSLEMRPGIAHRIDKDTSGLLVVAKNTETLVGLQQQFSTHTVSRVYHAIAWGQMEESGTVTTNLARDPANRLRMVVCHAMKGKLAVSNYRVLERFHSACLCEFKLHTGRTHQIRVHAKHLGHTLLSDDVYGGKRILEGSQSGARREFFQQVFATLPRQALHARTLGFLHPVTKQRLHFESPLPPDMAAAIEMLRNER